MYKEKNHFAKIKVILNIDFDDVRDLLQISLSGGYSPWIRDIKNKTIREDLSFCDFRMGGKLQDYKSYRQWFEIMPTIEGCSITLVVDDFESEEEKEFLLDVDSLKNGLQIMADNYPFEWDNFVKKRHTDHTADTFMQCCVYGKIVHS